MTEGKRPVVGVILSGCGALDGTEIQEAFCAVLALHRLGARVVYLAPDMEQCRVFDHEAKTERNARRNVLTESARFARGEIEGLAQVAAGKLDAIFLPGGFGAARTLSNFASALDDAVVIDDLGRLVNAMLDAGKPVGAVCVAVSIVGIVLRDRGVSGAAIAMGDNQRFFSALERMGHAPVPAEPTQVVKVDGYRIVTGPAFLSARSLPELEVGIGRVVEALLEMVA